MPKIAQLHRKDFFAGDESRIVVMDRFAQADMPMHRHEFAELVLILSGRAVHVTGEVRHRVGSGHVLFINPSRSHAYEETEQLRLANILVHEEVFREAEKDLGSLPGYHALFTLESRHWRHRDFTSQMRLARADFRQALKWLDALKQETEKPGEGGRLLGRCWLILILGLLARCYSRSAQDSPRLEMRLGRVLAWMDTHFREPVRVGELAKQAAMSERSFLRHFREATGVSPSDYLLRARIRLAMELLDRRRPGEPITDIAFRSGFEDSNYFARQFRKHTGKSPREFSARERR